MDASDLQSRATQALQFGPFRLDPQRAEVSRDGALISLRPKSFALAVLLSRVRPAA